MRPLKAYLERGESNEHVLQLINVLNQLEDDELAFIMAKYVTLATFRDDGNVIKQANATKLKDHLQIKDKDFKSLQNKVSNRVYDLYFASKLLNLLNRLSYFFSVDSIKLIAF